MILFNLMLVVLDTTKVQIFKQITTVKAVRPMSVTLFQIPQRYRFSSKSQQLLPGVTVEESCFRYHKGTDFQANHNSVVKWSVKSRVVLDTTKVQIFKQITTDGTSKSLWHLLFQIPQRYRFSSKSQPSANSAPMQGGCFRYHKGTDFQANHNVMRNYTQLVNVVLDTTKVQIFKQITTPPRLLNNFLKLFQIPQRYRFSSKSQQGVFPPPSALCCFRYHKGTDFQANHNNGGHED